MDDPDRAEAVRQRVIDTLQRPWKIGTGPTPRPEAGGLLAGRETIRVGLVGRSSDLTRGRELQDAVRAAVADELGSDQVAAASCICAAQVPGYTINLTTADIGWFVNGVWTPPPSGAPFWTIAVYLDDPGWNAARLILRDGATFNPPVPKNQSLIGLANDTDWAKEIWADNLCSGRIASVFQGGTNGTPRRMRLDQPDCGEGADTVVFRKPGFLGIWEDIGHFPTAVFWQALGGTWADFTWVVD